MAGHSKWKNIQHRKGRQDAKRAKIFTKISKEIFAAAKSGGDDPATNNRLGLAISKAKEANMPNDNIERTIKKAIGDVDGIQYDEILYEGYGPHGVAVMVECLTDNRNRTAADVRHIFSKNDGNLGEAGCVSYLFERKGLIKLAVDEIDEDELMLNILEWGAEDMHKEGNEFVITSSPNQLMELEQSLKNNGYELRSSEITMLPQTSLALEFEAAEKVIKLLDALEENDDVQNVYANFDLDESLFEHM